MELIPLNSKKIRKYNGPTQGSSVGRVFIASDHVYLLIRISKRTEENCSNSSPFECSTTHSNTSPRPLLHLEDRSHHHGLLGVVDVINNHLSLLQKLGKGVWHGVINVGLNEMTLVW